MDLTMRYKDFDPSELYKLPPGFEFAADILSGPGPELTGANTLLGHGVCNAQGEDLGVIKEIMLNMHTGSISYAVLCFGGFLGMGEKLFAVPWRSLTLDTQNKRVVLDVDRDRLKKAPGFDKDKWPSMADARWVEDIDDFYDARFTGEPDGVAPHQAGMPSETDDRRYGGSGERASPTDRA